MYRLLLGALLLLVTQLIHAQNENVQPVHNLKTGFIGISYAYEQPIAPKAVISVEPTIGLGFGSNIYSGNYWLLTPVLRVEPRYYYNFYFRQQKGKKTLNNTANYLSVTMDYQPGISIGKNADAIRAFSLIPKWGLKRAMGNHFIFEFAAGIGVITTETESLKPIVGLDIKFGLAF